MKIAIIGAQASQVDFLIEQLENQMTPMEIHSINEDRIQDYVSTEMNDDIIINFLSSKAAKDLILLAEDLSILSFDLGTNFIDDPTIPVNISTKEFLSYKDSLIFRIPESYVFVLSPIVQSLNESYRLKRFSAYYYEQYNNRSKLRDREDLFTNDISTLSNYKGRLSLSMINLPDSYSFYHLNIVFDRPFNVDDVLDFMNEHHLNIHYHERDLSVDSGINLWIQQENDQKIPLRHIAQLIKEKSSLL